MKDEILVRLSRSMEGLEKKLAEKYESKKDRIKSVHPSHKESAENLIRYLALRSEDIRDTQNDLHVAGLSSLASSESHILRQIQSIRQRLGHKYQAGQVSGCTWESSKKLIKQKSAALFGSKDGDQLPSIMVTFDSTFGDNYSLIKNLLLHGMNVARINCAHDDEATWARMISRLRKAMEKTGRSCKIYMDLAGPKIRTRIINKGKKKGRVKIHEGQMIWMANEAGDFDKKDVVIHPNEDGIIECLSKGDRVYIDDGMIQGEVEQVKKGRVGIRIIRISATKKQIKAGKGINFPDTELNIPALTKFDISVLPFVCSNADMVGYSFIRDVDDMAWLMKEMDNFKGRRPDLIIKVETPEAVLNLPQLLLEGMKRPAVGVMIARGDLAVEIGFERLSEIQEEILWICEAAHIPVIWATQVLESLNKSGMATRSEITDVVHSAQAECVMINKGLHTIEVMETLMDILKRTVEHKNKKRFIFRPLNIARQFFGEGTAVFN